MTTFQYQKSLDQTLRARAEREAHANEKTTEASPEQLQSAIHELHVHQIELEMQNEQLRLTQAELEFAREQYEELYDFAPVAYLTVDRDGNIRSANLTSVSMLGMERGRLLQRPLSRFVVSADQDTYHLFWRKAIASAGRQVCELRLQPAIGSLFFARLEGVQALEHREWVCRITFSDITDQKRAEEALRDSERRRLRYENEEWKRLAVEAADLGVWDQDLRSNRVVCSDRACNMLGFKDRESIDWSEIMARVLPEDRAGLSRELDLSTLPEGTRRCEAVFRIAAGPDQPRWLRLVARTFFEESPNFRAARRTGVLADITAQKQAEEVLRTQARQLDAMVAERTAQLQEAVGELEHFSYTLAHDLRAPLRTVAGYSELMLDDTDQLSPLHRDFLERSKAAVLLMDQLIVDTLNYNRILRDDWQLAPVESGPLLREIIDTYPQLRESRQYITIEGSLPVVLGNSALLTQCFSNLLTNALKFVPPGRQPRVRVFAQARGKRVRLWFEDNGIGIEPENFERIFRMFQRLNHEFEGTGIGLPLVKKAVERMGGAVGLESEPGTGSRFWLELNLPSQTA